MEMMTQEKLSGNNSVKNIANLCILIGLNDNVENLALCISVDAVGYFLWK